MNARPAAQAARSESQKARSDGLLFNPSIKSALSVPVRRLTGDDRSGLNVRDPYVDRALVLSGVNHIFGPRGCRKRKNAPHLRYKGPIPNGLTIFVKFAFDIELMKARGHDPLVFKQGWRSPIHRFDGD